MESEVTFIHDYVYQISKHKKDYPELDQWDVLNLTDNWGFDYIDTLSTTKQLEIALRELNNLSNMSLAINKEEMSFSITQDTINSTIEDFKNLMSECSETEDAFKAYRKLKMHIKPYWHTCFIWDNEAISLQDMILSGISADTKFYIIKVMDAHR